MVLCPNQQTNLRSHFGTCGEDPRPPLQERYRSKQEYVANIEAVAAKLVSERF